MREIDDQGLKEELQTWKSFLLDSMIESGSYRVFNVALEILDEYNLRQKLVKILEKLKCAAKLKVSFGFVLKIVEDRKSWFY